MSVSNHKRLCSSCVQRKLVSICNSLTWYNGKLFNNKNRQCNDNIQRKGLFTAYIGKAFYTGAPHIYQYIMVNNNKRQQRVAHVGGYNVSILMQEVYIFHTQSLTYCACGKICAHLLLILSSIGWSIHARFHYHNSFHQLVNIFYHNILQMVFLENYTMLSYLVYTEQEEF